jgi:hypothetical protein
MLAISSRPATDTTVRSPPCDIESAIIHKIEYLRSVRFALESDFRNRAANCRSWFGFSTLFWPANEVPLVSRS